MGKSKATKVEQDMQAREIMRWLVEGWDRQMIIREACKLWGYGNDRSVDALIKKARAEFVAAWEETDRKEYVAELTHKFNHLYLKGLEQRQLAVSHAAALAQAKLMGVVTY